MGSRYALEMINSAYMGIFDYRLYCLCAWFGSVTYVSLLSFRCAKYQYLFQITFLTLNSKISQRFRVNSKLSEAE